MESKYGGLRDQNQNGTRIYTAMSQMFLAWTTQWIRLFATGKTQSSICCMPMVEWRILGCPRLPGPCVLLSQRAIQPL